MTQYLESGPMRFSVGSKNYRDNWERTFTMKEKENKQGHHPAWKFDLVSKGEVFSFFISRDNCLYRGVDASGELVGTLEYFRVGGKNQSNNWLAKTLSPDSVGTRGVTAIEAATNLFYRELVDKLTLEDVLCPGD